MYNERMLTLIVGGTGSGKSEYAEREAKRLCDASGRPLLYIASLFDGGGESAAKIEKHRKRRACLDHTTAECYNAESLRKSTEKAGSGRVILFDSLDSFLACCLDDTGTMREMAEAAVDIIRRAAVKTDIIVVSDMVFSDGEIYDRLTTEYMAVLGIMLGKLSEFAESVTEVVCGIPVKASSGSLRLPPSPKGEGKKNVHMER